MDEQIKGPELIQTERLILRKPIASDAGEIFRRYASDDVATRYMSWPTHRSINDTHVFLAWSDAEWRRWPAGPYLVRSREDGRLLGGTGLDFQSAEEAATGYIFAQDAWGFGYATESLQAMVALARSLHVKQLEAVCHVDHRASANVLEKCGFRLTGIKPHYLEFPNLDAGTKCDVRSYGMKV
jgi:ribosomal-protein-alanine N-acetyltransferase